MLSPRSEKRKRYHHMITYRWTAYGPIVRASVSSYPPVGRVSRESEPFSTMDIYYSPPPVLYQQLRCCFSFLDALLVLRHLNRFADFKCHINPGFIPFSPGIYISPFSTTIG